MNIISLFCGAGGLDLGFERAGFRPTVAYDVKSIAVKTYNFNRGQDIACEVDLSKIDPLQIIQDLSNLKLATLPVGIIGGPPCQYYSESNSSPRDENDIRRILPVIYANILNILNNHFDLDFFAFENVAGLTKKIYRSDFQNLKKLFEEAGYEVYFSILNAHDFGVPQIRNRLFIVGWNKKYYSQREYVFPIGGRSGLTLRDAIANLKEPQFYERGLQADSFAEHENHWTMKPKSKKFQNLALSETKSSSRSFRRLVWDEPSPTVAYGHNEIHLHPNGHRRLSIYEAMLLQGFPSTRGEYRLLGNLSEQVSLISDAVPPPLAEAIAISFVNYMEQHKRL